ncbi:hypothetical protein GQ55_3G097700 [Panicum hallii var. hallii]|uniref:Uncharacterized protein n=1 Tax=Panicum hallii var. hallii TaxID=1504633 RepID=A0A2T7E7N0_9POAL|nr:hypothetical protein GQ55_3G097700 [Panicum hallii var. hallii]
MDATRRWGSPTSAPLSPLLSLSSHPALAATLPRASPAHPAALARSGAASRFPGGAGPRWSSSSPGLLRVPTGAQGPHSVRRPRRRRTTQVPPRCPWRQCRGLALLPGVPHQRREVLQERGAPDAVRSRCRCPWPGVIRPDSPRMLDLDASLVGELVGSSTGGRVSRRGWSVGS